MTEFLPFQMRAIEGVCFSYRLQRVLHSTSKISHAERKGSGVHNTSETTTTSASQLTPARSLRRSGGCNTTDNSVSANEGNSSGSALFSVDPLANPIRGARDVDSDVPNALNSQLYSMLRANRTSRRAFLNGLINLFDEMQVSYEVDRKSCFILVFKLELWYLVVTMKHRGGFRVLDFAKRWTTSIFNGWRV